MKKQILSLFVTTGVYALVVVIYFILPGGSGMPTTSDAPTMPDIPLWVLALANAGIVLVVYSLVGLIGLWLSTKAGLPGIYREGASRSSFWLVPLGVGAAGGVFLVICDWLFSGFFGLEPLPHPPFPGSILASLAAGIGEEILFRLFVMSLWAALLGWLARWLLPGRNLSLPVAWIANIIAALAFGAGHMGTVMLLFNAASPAELPAALIAEVFLLNGIIGLAAGELYRRHGLVAASGVHFWADMVWHVIYGIIA
jgi:membrane protease YdiL (CAAX protease family)